jgi:RimJ/RimL family protein N-acetyltransferase
MPGVTDTLETERLVLRPLHRDDLDALSLLHAESSFWRYPMGRGQSPAETEKFLDRVLDSYRTAEVGLHAVVERQTGALAGWAGLSVPTFLPEILPAIEVGWRLGTAWHGRGYATEAGAAWLRWGFERLDTDRIVSIFEPANVASGRVMAKLGFELKRVTVHPTRRIPLHVTVLTRDRWTERTTSRSPDIDPR